MSKIIRYAKHISWTLVGNEVFIFNEISNEIFLLKGINKDFWLLMLKTENLEEISSILATKYSEEVNVINNKLILKLKELIENNLIVTEDIQ